MSIKLELEGRAAWGVLFGLPLIAAACVAGGVALCIWAWGHGEAGSMGSAGSIGDVEANVKLNVEAAWGPGEGTAVLDITPQIAPSVVELAPAVTGGAVRLDVEPHLERTFLPVEPIVGDGVMRLMVETEKKEIEAPRSTPAVKRDPLPPPRRP